MILHFAWIILSICLWKHKADFLTNIKRVKIEENENFLSNIQTPEDQTSLWIETFSHSRSYCRRVNLALWFRVGKSVSNNNKLVKLCSELEMINKNWIPKRFPSKEQQMFEYLKATQFI